MKRIIIITAALLVVCATVLSVAANSITPALEVIAKDYSMTVSALKDESVTFNETQFFDVAGSDKIKSIKIVELPKKDAGTLYLYDAPVSDNQVVFTEELKSLSFIPEKGCVNASFIFTFDDSYKTVCYINFGDKNNTAPTVKEEISLNTIVSTTCTGNLSFEDKDGDSVKYEIVSYPKNGTFICDKNTGEFHYSSAVKTGTETVLYKAVDENGAYSNEGKVVINIIENKNSTIFSDMDNNPFVTAAICMTDAGYMDYENTDDGKSFSPEKEVSRLDFLVTAMNVFGAGNIPSVSNTGFADDEEIPKKYKGTVYSAKKLGIIQGIKKDAGTYFCPDKSISAAEASVIINNIIGYEPKSTSELEPAWAKESLSALNELGIYSPVNKNAPMNKCETAQMLYSVSCIICK